MFITEQKIVENRDLVEKIKSARPGDRMTVAQTMEWLKSIKTL